MSRQVNYIHDRPAKEDSLGREHFAKALSRSLVLPKDSDGLVVGIEGTWGSGKSTLIGFITHHLSKDVNKDDAPIVVEFNPWILSNTGALVEALMTQIAAAIGKDSSYEEKGINAGQKLLNYVGLLQHFKHLKYLKYVPGTSWLGNIFEDIPDIAEAVAESAEQSAEAGQKALDNLKKLLPSIDLIKQKTDVVEALRELNLPIVVVIDDLDRLPPEEIRSMIQAIKAVADFPRTTYLLAYDRDVVAHALSACDEAAGLLYLEKIVQVAYPIPPLFQRQRKKFVEDKLNGLLFMLGITFHSYEEALYERAIFLVTLLSKSPRDVIRIANRLLLSLPPTRGEVNSVDVIVFEALSQRFPKLREDIHNHPMSFIGHPFRGDLVDDDDAMNWGYWITAPRDEGNQPWTKFLPVNEHDRGIAEKACLFLFPPSDDNGSRVVYEDQLRIADPDRLARYFRMTSIEDVPEVKDVHEKLVDPEKLEEALATGNNTDLLFFLEWIFNYAPSCTKPNIKGSITKLVDASRNVMVQDRLTSEVASGFSKVMKRLLRLATNERNDCALHIVENAPLSIARTVVFEAATDHGMLGNRPSEREKAEDQLITDEKLIEHLIKTWSDRVRGSIAIGGINKDAYMHSVLRGFAELNGAYDEVYAAVHEICRTEEGLAKFLAVYQEDSPFSGLDQLALVEDGEILAQQIKSSNLQAKYQWFIEYLRKEEIVKGIKNQAEDFRKKRNKQA